MCVRGGPTYGQGIKPLPDNPDFLACRLLTELTEAINTCFWLHKDLLRRSLRENP
jgi:hypothetical protein